MEVGGEAGIGVAWRDCFEIDVLRPLWSLWSLWSLLMKMMMRRCREGVPPSPHLSLPKTRHLAVLVECSNGSKRGCRGAGTPGIRNYHELPTC